ncbi:MAG: UDP-N-acetylglucosamine 2-epimerase (non-hydrolyzing) [bacterium]|nr:UDP-N-acetylglucosamine 2-epimerase (non-hydrolyzing) [bacterium]
MRILFIFGTRPEAIKLAPLILEFQRHARFQVKVCITAQHNEMLAPVLEFFRIRPDYNLSVMKENQSLFHLTSGILAGLEKVLDQARPEIIFVQGDTASTLAGALAGFYFQCRVAYVESGLRSFCKYAPYPEEMNRLLAAQLSDIHFTPGTAAARNLRKMGIKQDVYTVGNTGIDALLAGLAVMKKDGPARNRSFSSFSVHRKWIIVTCHRRESIGDGIRHICAALKKIARRYSREIEIIFPVHLNPLVRKMIHAELKGIRNIHLIKPLSYPEMLYLMGRCYCILTDSGGIQEEAPYLGKPVLVLRNETERKEGIRAGVARLVGTDQKKIYHALEEFLVRPAKYRVMARKMKLYGDGKASVRIRKIISRI